MKIIVNMDKQFDTCNPPTVPVAVPLQHDQIRGEIPIVNAHADRPSLATAASSPNVASFRLPASRGIGELTPVTEGQIQQLVDQGYTRGYASILARTIQSFPLRIWVVDNSGSMQRTDGHRLVETGKGTREFKVVECSRWMELKDCVANHVSLAATLQAPTTFHMLNDPGCGINSQHFGIAEGTLDGGVLQKEVERATGILNSVQPRGVTPLIQHIENIKRTVLDMKSELLEAGCRVTVIIATDGLPTDERGYGGAAIQQQFVESLRGLEGLPVWVVVRLCTDKEKVVKFYNDLDSQLELSLDVLDDFIEEAREVYKHNSWLNYALPLHRLREMGYHDRFFDLFDERRLSLDELAEFCSILLLDNSAEAELPDPKIDW